jgi:hypothetical protein
MARPAFTAGDPSPSSRHRMTVGWTLGTGRSQPGSDPHRGGRNNTQGWDDVAQGATSMRRVAQRSAGLRNEAQGLRNELSSLPWTLTSGERYLFVHACRGGSNADAPTLIDGPAKANACSGTVKVRRSGVHPSRGAVNDLAIGHARMELRIERLTLRRSSLAGKVERLRRKRECLALRRSSFTRKIERLALRRSFFAGKIERLALRRSFSAGKAKRLQRNRECLARRRSSFARKRERPSRPPSPNHQARLTDTDFRGAVLSSGAGV